MALPQVAETHKMYSARVSSSFTSAASIPKPGSQPANRPPSMSSVANENPNVRSLYGPSRNAAEAAAEAAAAAAAAAAEAAGPSLVDEFLDDSVKLRDIERLERYKQYLANRTKKIQEKRRKLMEEATRLEEESEKELAAWKRLERSVEAGTARMNAAAMILRATSVQRGHNLEQTKRENCQADVGHGPGSYPTHGCQ